MIKNLEFLLIQEKIKKNLNLIDEPSDFFLDAISNYLLSKEDFGVFAYDATIETMDDFIRECREYRRSNPTEKINNYSSSMN